MADLKRHIIGVFDSGAGGLSVLRELVRLLPDEKYLYYSDNAYCPYGEKSPDFIKSRAEAIVTLLVGMGADIIVVACNTATAAAIAYLRERWSDVQSHDVRERVAAASGGRRDHIMFIGMEPAVKLAAGMTATGTIGVLATAGTLSGTKYMNAKARLNKNINVAEHVGEGFVELVENNMSETPEAESVVRRSLMPLLAAGADVIALGCTHYPFLMDVLQRVAGPSVTFIDPAPAVARQLARIMKEDGLIDEIPSQQARPSEVDVQILSSGDPSASKMLYEKLF